MILLITLCVDILKGLQGFFAFQSADSLLLGSLQKGSLDVVGAVVELIGGNRPGLEWIIRIQNPNMLSVFEMAVPAREEALDWMTAIKETVKNASVRVGLPGRFRLT